MTFRTSFTRVIFLLALVYFQHAAAQDRNALISVTELLRSAETKYKVHFAFDPAVCANIMASPRLLDLSVDDFTKALAKNTGFKVILQDNQHYLLLSLQEPAIKKEEKASAPVKEFLLSGKVYDAFTRETLIGVSIRTLPDNHWTETDLNGKFELRFKSTNATQKIEYRYLGYQLQELNLSESQLDLEVLLVPAVEFLEPVTFSALKSEDGYPLRISMPEVYTLRGDLRLLNNVFRDPMKSLQTLSGINGTDDISCGIQVRGSGNEENLILLDNLTLYSIDHFFGVFSNINPFAINELTLYKSYIPATYGGRASSLIKMKSNEPSGRTELKAEVGILNSNLYVNTPVGTDRINLMAAGRISTTNLGETNAFANLLNNANSATLSINREQGGFAPVNPDFRFHDVYSRLTILTSKKTRLNASFFRSFDQTTSSYSNVSQFADFRIREDFHDTASWTNTAASVSFGVDWSKKFNSEICWSRSTLTDTQVIFGIITEFRRDTSFRRREMSTFKNSLRADQLRFSNRFVADHGTYDFGFEFNIYDTYFNNTINRNSVFKDSLANGNDYNLFIQAQYHLPGNFELNPGIRISRYNRRQKNDFSPRVNLSYRWNSHFVSSVRWGIYYQYLRQTDFEDRFGRSFAFWLQPDEKKFRILTSRQWELQNIFSWKGLQISLELYLKNSTGVAEQLFSTPFLIPPPGVSQPPLPRTLILNGEGESYGLDLGADKKFGNYTLSASYSFINSTVNFSQINQGEPYAKRLVRPHQFKLQQSLDLKKFGFQLYGIYGAPQPYVDLSLVADRDRKVISVNENTRQIPYYFRLDTDVHYKWSIRGTRFRAGFSILNATNHKNVKYLQYVFNVPVRVPGRPNQIENKVAGSEVNLLSRTLNVYLIAEF